MDIQDKDSDSEKKKSLLKFIDDTLFMINSPASKSQQTSLCPINFSNCLPTTSDHNITRHVIIYCIIVYVIALQYIYIMYYNINAYSAIRIIVKL